MFICNNKSEKVALTTEEKKLYSYHYKAFNKCNFDISIQSTFYILEKDLYLQLILYIKIEKFFS
jgi:hypothetical protein